MNRVLLVGLCFLCCGGCSPSAPKPIKVANGAAAIVEAESDRKSSMVGTHYWMVEPEGNPAHLVAFPADNTVFDGKGSATGAPCVEYRVIFEAPGTYYLWVRGKGEPGGASVVPGLDGRPLSEEADFIGFFPGQFSWLGGLYNSSKRAILHIDSPGAHVVHFWMLEDGFRFDKFMITSDSSHIPE